MRCRLLTAVVLCALSGCASGRYGPLTSPLVPPQPVVFAPPTTMQPLAVAPAPQADPMLGVATPGPVVAVPVPPPVPMVVPPGMETQPVIIPATHRDYVWDQIVDVVDDYFEIEQEERVKVIGDVLTEGRIDTFPLTGATIFEPWRQDSVNMYERWESTLQSIRRRAFIRVIPDTSGYLVDVAVMKELEDVERPIRASAGAATFRYDTSLERDREFDTDPYRLPGDPARPVGPRIAVAGWIPLGRDPALEQEILAKIQARTGAVAATGPGFGPAMPPTVPGPAYYAPQGEAIESPVPIDNLPAPQF